MEIFLSDEGALVCALTKQEMKNLPADVNALDYGDRATRQMLVELLREGRVRTGFSSDAEKLLVTVYPRDNGGCLIRFTPVEERFPSIRPITFAFRDTDLLCNSAEALFGRYGKRIYKSSLYHYKGEYRLVVHPLDSSDRLSCSLLAEFGRFVGTGEALAAHIDEHGTPLVLDNAMDVLADHFSP